MAQIDPFTELLNYLERVRAIARTGLAFNPSGYDCERYEELLKASADLLARLSADDTALAAALAQRWRELVSAGADGYVTVRMGCGAVVFNAADEILLVERSDGGWWLPSGWCDLGYNAAQIAVKEVKEETGLDVTPLHLMAVLDSRAMGSAQSQFAMALFYCRLDGGSLVPHPLETRSVGFYPLDRLPSPLALPYPGWIEMARQFHFGGRREAFFDL
jgi:ADP-ribose pyrophosphatase YjhB (NUDIX family)